MNHSLQFVGRNANDTKRGYYCVVCKCRVELTAPMLFTDYDRRYDRLLQEASAEQCPGHPLPRKVQTPDGTGAGCQ